MKYDLKFTFSCDVAKVIYASSALILVLHKIGVI